MIENIYRKYGLPESGFLEGMSRVLDLGGGCTDYVTKSDTEYILSDWMEVISPECFELDNNFNLNESSSNVEIKK